MSMPRGLLLRRCRQMANAAMSNSAAIGHKPSTLMVCLGIECDEALVRDATEDPFVPVSQDRPRSRRIRRKPSAAIHGVGDGVGEGVPTAIRTSQSSAKNRSLCASVRS